VGRHIFFVGAFAFAFGAALVYFAIAELVRDDSLGAGAVIVEARVTDTRVIISPRRGASYEVRYAFDVGRQTYSHCDATGRTDLWAPLTEDAWNAAQTSGGTQVAYVPADPWINRAVDHAGTPLEGHLAGLCTGLVCMSPTLLWALRAIRRRRVHVP
jgi:hypothetical protein